MRGGLCGGDWRRVSKNKYLEKVKDDNGDKGEADMLTARADRIRALLIVAISAATMACGVRTTSGEPKATSTEHVNGAELALLKYKRTIDAYEANSTQGDALREDQLPRVIDRMAALAVTHPPARAEVSNRRAVLGRSIALDPGRVSSRRVDVYIQLCRVSADSEGALALLRDVTKREPTAVGVRRRLMSHLLDWMRERKLYGDIGANRDVLEGDLELSGEMRRYFTDREAKVAAVLYEAALGSGQLEMAHKVADGALASDRGGEHGMLPQLLDAATRLGVKEEAERLRAVASKQACPGSDLPDKPPVPAP
jgi:hypothetical protein